MPQLNQTMILVKDSLQGQYETFRVIPISPNAPYLELAFNPILRSLLLQSKDRYQTFTVLEKIGVDGQLIALKKAVGEQKYQVERVRSEGFVRYEIKDIDAIRTILSALAVNYDTFDLAILDKAAEPVTPESETAEVAEAVEAVAE